MDEYNFTQKYAEMLEETYKEVREIRQALKGYNGQSGLLGMVTDLCKRMTRLEIIIAAIIGTGGLSGAAFGIVKLIGS